MSSATNDPFTIPLFPLPEVVLFGGMLLPLHVFEPRYLQLMEDVLDKRGWIGMALLQPGWEQDYYGRPDLHPILGVGEIVKHEKTEDGRFYLMLVGVGRARVKQVFDENPYRSAELCFDFEEHDLSEAICAKLLPVMLDHLSKWQSQVKRPLLPVRPEKDPVQQLEYILNLFCTHLVTDANARQKLLETDSLSQRLESLLQQHELPDLEVIYRST